VVEGRTDVGVYKEEINTHVSINSAIFII